MNPNNGVYDKDDQKPVTKPGLLNLETGKQTPEKKEGGRLYRASGEASGLAGLEKMEAFANKRNLSPVSERIRAFAGRNKKRGAIGGAIGVFLLMAGIIGFASLTSLELETIAKDLLGYEAKIEKRFEQKAASKLFSQIMCSKLTSGSKSWSTLGCAKAGDEDIQETEGDSGPLAKNLESFDPTDPAVKTALAEQGIEVKGTPGNFSGFVDSNTGEAITADDIQNDNNGVFDRMETALPEWSVGQLESFRSLMGQHADASFDVVPEDQTDDVDKIVTDEVSDGTSSTSPFEAPGEEGTEPPPAGDNNPTDQNNYSQDEQLSGETADAVNATENALNNGDSEAQSIDAGVNAAEKDAGGAASDALITGGVSNLCSVEKAASDAAKTRVPLIQKLLIRHFTTVISLASQLQTGHITGGAVNSIMTLFNGSGQTTTASRDSPDGEATLPFTASAAWQRITGNSVNTDRKSKSYTPDIAASALPTENSSTKVEDQVSSVIGGTGLAGACSVLNSSFGGIVSGIFGAVQIVGDFSLVGLLGQATIIGGNVALSQLVSHEIIPLVLSFFTPVGVNGHEDSVQWMNNADAGGSLAFNDYSRSLGAEPATMATGSQQYALASSGEIKAESNASLANKIFAVSNPDSLVSHIIMSLPTTKVALVSSITNFFTDIPTEIGSVFSSLFSSSFAFAATPPQYPGEPYGITPYVFPDNEVTKYNPIANEEYLNTKVTDPDTNQSATRISLLGDPNMYQNTSDPSTNDILHCFTQSTFTGNYSSGDPICGSVGDYDYATNAPSPITDSNVALSYCDQLGGGSDCPSRIASQLNDDIGHFREYLLDVHVMSDYTSLTNNN